MAARSTIDVGDATFVTVAGMLVTSNDAFVHWTYPLKEGAMAMKGGHAFADGVVRVFDPSMWDWRHPVAVVTVAH